MNQQTMSCAHIEDQLRKASDAYYNGNPIMSDVEFDALWHVHKANREMMPDDPVWQDTILDRVGAPVKSTSGFQKVAHATPMLSLDNVFEVDGKFDQVDEWLAKLPKFTPVVIEPKVDGLSLSLVYEDGKLVDAVTRGDGTTGDSVIANIHPGMGIPMTLPQASTHGFHDCPGRVEVRGEVFMPIYTFLRLRQAASDRGEPLPANPRNAAAGALRLHDPTESQNRGLQFVAYSCQGYRYRVTDHLTEMQRLKDVGFTILPPCAVVSGMHAPDWNKIKEDLMRGKDFQIDGLVLKVDTYAIREQLGFTSRAPRWAVALKFKQPAVTTVLKAITVQVGRSGVLTPVAELEPVEVDGSVVSRATLHNEGQINRLGLQVGDTVEIEKAGGIIPAVTRSVTRAQRLEALREFHKAKEPELPGDMLDSFAAESLDQERSRFNMLAYVNCRCPSCSQPVVTRTQPLEAARTWCANDSCPAKLAAKLLHMCGRKALDISGIGDEMAESTAHALFDQARHEALSRETLMPSPLEILLGLWQWDIRERRTQWLAARGWKTDSGTNMSFGKTRAEKAMEALERSKQLPLHRWLFALGIPSVGENTSKEISRLFETPMDLTRQYMDNSGERDGSNSILWQIAKGADKTEGWLAKFSVSHHLGPVSAQALLDFVGSHEGRQVLSLLTAWGVKSDNCNPVPAVESAEGPLAGKSVCVTGTLSVPREAIHELIVKAGGTVATSVSKKTSILVAGEKAGSKIDKAKALGVEVWSEQQLRETIG